MIRRTPTSGLFIEAVTLLTWPPVVRSADKPAIKPTTHLVAMSDGIKLATDVYVPEIGRPPYPAILLLTPYGKSGAKPFASRFCQRGYAFVSQDIRGRGQSEGHHAVIFHHGGWAQDHDGHDTIRWVAKRSWCKGNVALFGGSALGITQNMLAVDAPLNLKAHFGEVAFSNMYAQCGFKGGVLRSSLIEGWLKATKMVEGNLDAFLAHPNYDAFWAELNPEAQAHRVDVPAIFLGGWYDIFLQGTINSFVTIENKGGPRARGNCRLVIGPWAHGGFKGLKYPANSRRPEVADALRFFDYWLKGVPNGVPEDKPVHYYVMGDPADKDAPGNFWRTADNWPPRADATPFYFHADGTLRRSLPPTAAAKLTYTYDPKNPVPTVGGQNLLLPKGPMDQRKVESRPDVLLFTTEPLTEPLEVHGRIIAKPHVSSAAPDTAFTVKLTDVYADGRSLLGTDGILRARHRKSYETEDFLGQGEIYELTIDLWSTSLVFNKGHKIRVAVSSSNHPRFDPNPNTGRPLRADAETRPATNTLHLSEKHPSHIVLPLFRGESP